MMATQRQNFTTVTSRRATLDGVRVLVERVELVVDGVPTGKLRTLVQLDAAPQRPDMIVWKNSILQRDAPEDSL